MKCIDCKKNDLTYASYLTLRLPVASPSVFLMSTEYFPLSFSVKLCAQTDMTTCVPQLCMLFHLFTYKL